MRLLALATYSDLVASTRFRVTQWIPYLERAGVAVDFVAFLRDEDVRALYRPGTFAKARSLIAASFRQLTLLAGARGYDGVFVQRGAALIGPPLAEFISRSVYGLPLIFDLDDAIWELDLGRSRNPLAARLLKNPRKVFWLRDAADLVVAGSSYLARWAGGPSKRVMVVPTVVSRDLWTPRPRRLEETRGRTVLGWIGTHSTADQLQLVAPALRRLASERHDFVLRVIGAGDDFRLPGVPLESLPWSREVELQSFQDLDIGLAPMRDLPVYEGKCGFKQLQYMAVGVPQVCSVVGGARDFVVHEKTALVAQDSEDWYPHLKRLLNDPGLRRRLAANGRRLVEGEYSAEVQGPRLAAAIARVLREARQPKVDP